MKEGGKGRNGRRGRNSVPGLEVEIPAAGTGTLYIVGTPIGNLEDITFRAVRILREVGLIAAEDTRHTRKLLSHFGISKPLTSYFDHNSAIKGDVIIGNLQGGTSVALVTDAGTPCISDPGYQLVRDAVAAGIPVVPVPGPSAAIAALSASGLPSDSFAFEGFLPSRKRKRVEALRKLSSERRLLVFYESPQRLADSLRDMHEILGDREAVVAREMTKLHEEIARGALSEICAIFSGRVAKGEIVILVAPASAASVNSSDGVEDLLARYRKEGYSVRDAVKAAATVLQISRSEAYTKALEIFRQDEKKV